MQLAHTINEVREHVRDAQQRGWSIGLVPTMGALHEGHLSLMRAARERCGYVAISIFVNPTQFGPAEDFEAYPRELHGDLAAAEAVGMDLVFAPSVEEMYPGEPATTVTVARLTDRLCGAFRPGHFAGVTTVVAKLFNIIQPDCAYFGEKDFQQLQVIHKMVADLHLPIEIVSCATVREPDGLALSSRNKHLSPDERRVAPKLYEALRAGARVVRQGGAGREAQDVVRDALAAEPLFRLQYVEAVRPDTLEPDDEPGPPMVVAAAAFLGSTRLIDNVVVTAGP